MTSRRRPDSQFALSAGVVVPTVLESAIGESVLCRGLRGTRAQRQGGCGDKGK
jgi:hypothetical protein